MRCRYIRRVARGVTSGRANLCSALSVDLSKFEEILARPDHLRFRRKEDVIKSDGEIREVYCPSWDVRVLLRRFNKRFFANPAVIKWPYFIFGCVPNDPREKTEVSGRDYISCAAKHCGSKSILKVDVANFFSSISQQWVEKVFQKTMLFSQDLAHDMGVLNCVNGSLVQGSPCASYVAAAILGVKEGKLVKRLEAKGYTYTRYVDDITISSKRRGERFILALRLVDEILSDHDLERNVEKTKILRSGTSPLLVHGVNVGGAKVCVPRDDFKAIRASVHALERYAASNEYRSTHLYRRMFMRCTGLVGKLARTGDKRSAGYFERLKKVRPLSTKEDLDMCTRWVREVERNSKTRSNYFFQVRQANRTYARLAILAWTYPQEAADLKARLKPHVLSYDEIKI